MKKVFILFGCIYFMNLSSCFPQLLENNKKEYRSKTSVVKGYSNDYNELDIGITFGKIINLIDTTYYIKFQIYAPTSDFRKDIQIYKTSSITFLSKSGRTVDLKLTNVISSTEKEKQVVDQYSTDIAYSSTILILDITKEKFIEIGSEPFYNLILPYYNSSSKVENKAIFAWPTLLTRRNFNQKSVKYILDI
jgi:hypothetical protein